MVFELLAITTNQKKEVLDITDLLNEKIKFFDINQGLLHIALLHTTCAITTADLDPGTDFDMLEAFEAMIPNLKFRHPHNPAHTKDHILSSLIGTQITLPISNNRLVLGTWQRVVLIEFNGPRRRELYLTLLKS